MSPPLRDGLLLALALAAGCAAVDEDGYGNLRNDKGGRVNQPAAASSPVDAGPPESPDAATPAPRKIFDGAGEFSVITPSKESTTRHEGVSNVGKDCLLCHNGSTIAPKFLLAGTVVDSTEATQPRAQVRIIDRTTGGELALFGTDTAGNFWLEPTVALPTLPANARIGVRTSTKERAMNQAIPNGACNQSGCHVGGKVINLGL